MSALLVLLECSSRQNGASPMAPRRRKTTSRAARFSETKRTERPCASEWATRLVIVWDLPVPGGPCSTKLFPFSAAKTAASCDESASRGQKTSPGGRSSTCWGVMKSTGGSGLAPDSTRWRTAAFPMSWSWRAARSNHIRNLANEK
jgi:hypothetical protein